MTVDILLMQDFQDRKNHKSLWLFSRILTASNFSPNRERVSHSHFLQHTSLLYENRWWRCGACNWGYPYENEDALRKNCQFILSWEQKCVKKKGLFSNQRRIIEQRRSAEEQHAPGFFKHYVWLKFKAFLHTATRMYDSRALTSSKPSITLFFCDNLTRNYARTTHRLFFPKL